MFANRDLIHQGVMYKAGDEIPKGISKAQTDKLCAKGVMSEEMPAEIAAARAAAEAAAVDAATAKAEANKAAEAQAKADASKAAEAQ